jgi:UDPglucose 6-dehydrogenase/GDP-mannose 6-dehydrogenase
MEDALEDAKAAVIVTRWPEFQRLPEILDGRADPPLVVDGRRMLDKGRIARYEGIGL